MLEQSNRLLGEAGILLFTCISQEENITLSSFLCLLQNALMRVRFCGARLCGMILWLAIL